MSNENTASKKKSFIATVTGFVNHVKPGEHYTEILLGTGKKKNKDGSESLYDSVPIRFKNDGKLAQEKQIPAKNDRVTIVGEEVVEASISNDGKSAELRITIFPFAVTQLPKNATTA